MEIKNKRLVLRDDTGKVVCTTTSFRLEDDTIVTPTCLIYTEKAEELFGGVQESIDEVKIRDGRGNDVPELNADRGKGMSELNADRIDVALEPSTEQRVKLKGRNITEMLDLFGKDRIDR